jgi:hypothetical protein
MPQNVQKAYDYFDDAPAPSTDMQELLQQNMKLRECGQLLVEWRKQSEVEDDDHAPRESSRITSRDIFGLPYSATGDEAIALLKSNRELKEGKAAASAAKKNEAQAKKAQDTAARVIAGTGFIDKIKKNGHVFLDSLRIDDYYSLLVHANPHGAVKKPKNKKDGYEKASELATVRTALGVFAAAAAAIPRMPPPPPPPPRFSEGQNRISLGSVGSSDFRPIAVDPIDAQVHATIVVHNDTCTVPH